MSSIDALIKALDGSADKESAISNYLRGTVGSASADWLNVGPKGECALGPAVDGAKCMALIDKCIAGEKQNCVNEWKDLKFEAGFDESSIDVGVARNLLKKLDINGDVDAWVKTNSLSVDPRVVTVLKKLVNKTSGVTGASAGYRLPSGASVLSPRPVFTLVGGGMVGGGNRNNAVANFVQMSDYLKNQYVLVGGSNAAPSSVSALRQSLNQLEQALTAKGKAIDATDKQRIVQLFDSLQSTEEKAMKAAKYMNELRRLVNHPKFPGTGSGDVTAKMMEELTTKHSELLKAAERKSYNLLSILETIAGVADDVKALKAKVGA